MYRTPATRRDRGIIRPVIIGGVLVGAALVGTGVVGLDLFDNPLSTTTVDRSPAPILTELRDLGEYHAAQASFEVIVDQEQTDRSGRVDGCGRGAGAVRSVRGRKKGRHHASNRQVIRVP